jgi:hypothetical protein
MIVAACSTLWYVGTSEGLQVDFLGGWSTPFDAVGSFPAGRVSSHCSCVNAWCVSSLWCVGGEGSSLLVLSLSVGCSLHCRVV